MRVPAQLAVAAAALLAACAAPGEPGRLADARRPVRSFLEMRQAGVVIQKWDISCGAAALATILTYQHGDGVSEREVAAGMLRTTSVELVRQRLGFSLLDLKRYAQSRGLTADGYGDLSFDDLEETAPAIVPVQLRGLPHFVVFRGHMGDRVLLADPAFGNRTMTRAVFERIWVSRIAFTVSRTDGRAPPNMLAVQSKDFWATSLAFNRPAESEPAPRVVLAEAAAAPPEPAREEGGAPAAQPGGQVAAAGEAGRPGDAAAPPADAPAAASPPRQAAPPARPPWALATRAPAPRITVALARPAEPPALALPAAAAVTEASQVADPPSPAEAARHRADALLALGDVSGARLLYAYAARLGSGMAARLLAETYDPAQAAHRALSTLPPDASEAVLWYRRAAALGDAVAPARLRALGIAAEAPAAPPPDTAGPAAPPQTKPTAAMAQLLAALAEEDRLFARLQDGLARLEQERRAPPTLLAAGPLVLAEAWSAARRAGGPALAGGDGAGDVP